MFTRPTIAGLTAAAAVAATLAAGSTTASADAPAHADARLGSLTQKKPATLVARSAAVQPQRARCRAWHVQGQTWYAYQDNGYTLMFTLRPSLTSSRVGGYARYYRGQGENFVSSQYISGGMTTFSGIVGIHLDIVWSNGSSGQYNATAYDARPTRSGGLTASLRGTTVDTSGGGGAAHWYADGLEGPLGDTGFIRPLYCLPRDVVR